MTQTMPNKRFTIILVTIAILLTIPFIAMQFTNEVNWSAFDFGVAAVLLLGTGLTIELVFQKVKTPKNRFILLAAILFILFLIWAELAVGIFGTPFAGS
jgi:uncharacterized membrane protein